LIDLLLGDERILIARQLHHAIIRQMGDFQLRLGVRDMGLEFRIIEFDQRHAFLHRLPFGEENTRDETRDFRAYHDGLVGFKRADRAHDVVDAANRHRCDFNDRCRRCLNTICMARGFVVTAHDDEEGCSNHTEDEGDK
jgi:hypothetical protein